MNICKVTNNEKVESYYLICRNHNDEYQAVAFPWGRIDYRCGRTPEEVFNIISNIVNNKGAKVEWTTLHYEEIKNV